MPIRRKRRPYRSPDEIALHNAEEALQTEPEGRPRWRRFAAPAITVAICAVGVIGGGMLVAANDDELYDGRNNVPVRVGVDDSQLLNSTFVDSLQRVCTELRDGTNASIPLLAGDRCIRLPDLATHLDYDPAFVTGVALGKRFLMFHGYAQPTVTKVFFRNPAGKASRVAPVWQPDADRYPGLELRSFLIRIRLAGDVPRTGQVRDHVPNIFCRIAGDVTRVTLHPDLANAVLDGQEGTAGS
jgi:hypothetical protein